MIIRLFLFTTMIQTKFRRVLHVGNYCEDIWKLFFNVKNIAYFCSVSTHFIHNLLSLSTFVYAKSDALLLVTDFKLLMHSLCYMIML